MRSLVRGLPGVARPGDERGSVLVIAAFFVPVLILFGTFAVDVGNWYVHKRHLQTQADAAALAGGSQFALPCNATVNGKVVSEARKYAGPSSTGNTGPFNPQVSGFPSTDLHVLMNANDFWGQGPNDTEFGGQWGPQPCDKGFLDVKITQKNLPWFFKFLGSGVLSTTNAEARVRFSQTTGDKGFLPLGLPAPKAEKVTATITACNSTNSAGGTVVATVPLVKAGTQPVAGQTLWVSATPTIALTKPGFSQCVGDYMSLDTNVEVSGSPLVTPNLNICGAKFVDCYQTSEGRVWTAATSPAAEQDAPVFRDVNLGPGCGPGTPYWSSGSLTNLPCAFPLTAFVDWGSLPTLANHTGFHEILTASGGGGTSPSGNDACKTTGTCAFASGVTSGDGTVGTQPNGAAGMQEVTIGWEYWWDNGPNGYKCKPSKHCSGTSAVLARGNADDQSTVVRVVLTNQDASTGSYFGLPMDSFPNGSFPAAASLEVYTSDGFQVGQRAVLRQGISQGNQSLVCDPDYTNGKTFQMIVNGCKPLYGINNLDGTVDQPPRTPGMSWEPCPSQGNFFFYPQSGNTSTWYCIPTEPGKRPSQVSDGITARTGNCDNINNNGCAKPDCNYPNNWVAGKSYNPNAPVGAPDYDPRVVMVYFIPVGSLNTSSGNDVVEVVGFAGFYVTGWNANGANSDPCAGSTAGLNPEDVPKGSGGIAGRFVKLVDPEAVPNPTQTCDPNSVIPCTVVLVR